ncbi:MAG: MlaD family protein [Desulfomonilia bacterium]|nr:MlaD family protein [Desulfomonilia bacterium]
MTNEAKVGIFVVIILILFILLSMQIGELTLGRKETYPITMVFSSVEGLKESSPLELAGVEVGKVVGISLNKDYSALVRAAIHEDIRLPIDSTASIATKGVLGDKIIILTPGVSSNIIEPGGNLARTRIPPSLDLLLTQIGELAANLTELTGVFNEVFGDEELLRGILNNVHQFSESAASILSENREGIAEIVISLGEITDNFATVSQNLSTTSDHIDQITNTISAGEGTLGKLVHDDTLYLSLVDFLDSAQAFTSRLNDDSTVSMLMTDPSLYENLLAVSENIRFISEEIASGRGTLGHILVDDDLYQEIKETIRSVNLAAQGIEEQTPITIMGTILGLIW